MVAADEVNTAEGVQMYREIASAVTIGLLVFVALTGGCRYEPEPGADLVLVNGRVVFDELNRQP